MRAILGARWPKLSLLGVSYVGGPSNGAFGRGGLRLHHCKDQTGATHTPFGLSGEMCRSRVESYERKVGKRKLAGI